MSNKPVDSEQQRAHIEAEPNRDQIQERAYYRYVERGRADGKALTTGSSPKRRSGVQNEIARSAK